MKRSFEKGDEVFVCYRNHETKEIIKSPAKVTHTDYRRKSGEVFVVGDHFGMWADVDNGSDWPIWLEKRA